MNSCKELTVASIKQKTGLTDELINSAIAIMAGPSSILIKTGDSYTVQESFKSPLKRLSLNKLPKNDRVSLIISINIIVQRSKEQIKDQEDRVKEDRRFQIEAMLIKIMKDRKTLCHNDLMAELLTKANFPLDTTLVKQRIESLIEKDYIKRNAQDATLYEYLA